MRLSLKQRYDAVNPLTLPRWAGAGIVDSGPVCLGALASYFVPGTGRLVHHQHAVSANIL